MLAVVGGACGEDVEFIRHVVMVVDPARKLAETLVVSSPAP